MCHNWKRSASSSLSSESSPAAATFVFLSPKRLKTRAGPAGLLFLPAVVPCDDGDPRRASALTNTGGGRGVSGAGTGCAACSSATAFVLLYSESKRFRKSQPDRSGADCTAADAAAGLLAAEVSADDTDVAAELPADATGIFRSRRTQRGMDPNSLFAWQMWVGERGAE